MPYGPVNPISIHEHASKHRIAGETFLDQCNRVSGTLSDNEDHRRDFRMSLLHQNFIPAGRIQKAVGSPLKVTPYNCFVSGPIEDDSNSIFDRLKESFNTMRMGGGIGYDFSRLRPRGALISTVQAGSSGAVSFMYPFDATCKTARSAGGRQGAQMSVLRVDHPDIEEFIAVKQNTTELSAFNLSIGVTDEFMYQLANNLEFNLMHEGKIYATVDAAALWNSMMRATWDWAEPGVLFLDTINRMNNLYYCETIEATNPCAEQPLPPYGACLLGSSNLVQYIRQNGSRFLDLEGLAADIPGIVRAMDNVIDSALYPLPEQEAEAKAKRRMGLGVTGAANAIEALGCLYGDDQFTVTLSAALQVIRDESYRASVRLAEEKGPFPLFDREKYMDSKFIATLPDDIRDGIAKHGIRNSHLTSIAPTGTISLAADNISSGIEPVFAYKVDRQIINEDGATSRVEQLEDYGVKNFGTEGRTADDLTPEEHVTVLCEAQKFVDSSIAKTCNVGEDVSFQRFKDIYKMAYDGGAKGCTTFRGAGKRYGIISNADSKQLVEREPSACFIDSSTGSKTCS